MLKDNDLRDNFTSDLLIFIFLVLQKITITDQRSRFSDFRHLCLERDRGRRHDQRRARRDRRPLRPAVRAQELAAERVCVQRRDSVLRRVTQPEPGCILPIFGSA